MQTASTTQSSYLLVIDTDTYAGNFERELCAYATGLWTQEMHHGEQEGLDAIRAGGQIACSIAAKSDPQFDEEYGVPRVEQLHPTAGRFNNGMGVTRDICEAEPGKTTYPAYESIAVFLSAPLSEREMEFVRTRAAEYAANAGGDPHRKAFAIRDVYLVERQTTRTERRLA